MKRLLSVCALFAQIALAVEQPPPHWSVVDIDGRQVVATNGQVFVLVFAMTPCAPVDAMWHQTLLPLAKGHPDVQTILLFPGAAEASVRGWSARHGPLPSNVCAVALSEIDLLAAMYLEPGTNIWPTSFLIDSRGLACAKWRSFVPRGTCEPVICRETADLRIGRDVTGGAVVSWRNMPIAPTVEWRPPSSPYWTEIQKTNGASVGTGFYRLKW